MYTFYENHILKDPKFPFIFHLDTLTEGSSTVPMHWHENIEMLYFIDGSGIIACDTEQYTANVGDIVIINSNNLHWIKPITPHCKYYCLIVDKSFCDDFDIFIGDITIKNIIKDSVSREYFDMIIQEMVSVRLHYKTAIKSYIMSLMVHLCRHYMIDKNALAKVDKAHNKVDMIKAAISYIRMHYKENLLIDEICDHIGFSKYYFCHTFKEITGKTVIDYINFLRCSYAQILLTSGKYNVSECLEACGFNNMSYFCKTYKKYMGKSPSEQIRQNNKN